MELAHAREVRGRLGNEVLGAWKTPSGVLGGEPTGEEASAKSRERTSGGERTAGSRTGAVRVRRKRQK